MSQAGLLPAAMVFAAANDPFPWLTRTDSESLPVLTVTRSRVLSPLTSQATTSAGWLPTA